MSAAAKTVAVITGTTDTVAEAFRLIRTVHPDADETTVRVCEATDSPEGPRAAANVMISSMGVAAILHCATDSTAAGAKRCAPSIRVHYAFYAAPQ